MAATAKTTRYRQLDDDPDSSYSTDDGTAPVASPMPGDDSLSSPQQLNAANSVTPPGGPNTPPPMPSNGTAPSPIAQQPPPRAPASTLEPTDQGEYKGDPNAPQPPNPPATAAKPEESENWKNYKAIMAAEPKPPKSGALKTIGQTLLAGRFGAEGAERLMHPSYTAQKDAWQKQLDRAGLPLQAEMNQSKFDEQKAVKDSQILLNKEKAGKIEDDNTARVNAELDRNKNQTIAADAKKFQNDTNRFNAFTKDLNVVYHSPDQKPLDGYEKLSFENPAVPGMAAYVPLAKTVPKEFIDEGVLPGRTAADIGKTIPKDEYNQGATSYHDILKIRATAAEKPDPTAKENPNQWEADAINPDPTISGPAKQKLANAASRQTGIVAAGARAGADARRAAADQPASPINPGTPEFRVAQDMAYGKLTMQQFRQLYSYSRDITKKLSLYDKARELNPDFNPSAFEAGFTLAKNPKVQQQLASMDNVVQATPDLLKFSDQASRTGLPILNKLVLPGGYALGGKTYSNLHLARTAYADELSGALGFGGATDMSRKMGFDMADPNLSPEAFRAGIQNVIIPFVERKRDTLLKQMGPYGQPGMNPAAGPVNGAPSPAGPPPQQKQWVQLSKDKLWGVDPTTMQWVKIPQPAK